jgi:hypothetical protein
MRTGDIITFRAKRNASGSFQKILEKDWLLHVGFTEKELEADEIELVAKFEVSEHKHLPFIGIGRPVVKK